LISILDSSLQFNELIALHLLLAVSPIFLSISPPKVTGGALCLRSSALHQQTRNSKKSIDAHYADEIALVMLDP